MPDDQGDSPDDERSTYDARDEDTGKIVPKFSDDEFLDAIATVDDSDPPVTTKKIADVLECHRNTSLKRLNELEEEGKVQRLEVGRSYIWRVV